MATHKSTWKRRERDAAGIFGARRQRCSGSSGRPDCSRSDSTHPTIYLETKLRRHHAAVALLDATRALARKESRVPVLALATKGRPGVVLVVAEADLAAVLAEFAAALDEAERDRLEGMIRRAVARRRGDPSADPSAELPADHDVPAGWPPQLGRSAGPAVGATPPPSRVPCPSRSPVNNQESLP